MSAVDPRATEFDEAGRGETTIPADLAWRGIELCRRDDWQEGVYWLGLAAETDDGAAEAAGSGPSGSGLPGLSYAYLGYGVARYQGRKEEGLRLCQRAVEMDLYQPECYDFLARIHLLMGDRRSAFQVVERGLEIDADNRDLREVRFELGERRPSIFGFLPRSHFLNRWLGRIRHWLLGPGGRNPGDRIPAPRTPGGRTPGGRTGSD